jgi:hypothetical protein
VGGSGGVGMLHKTESQLSSYSKQGNMLPAFSESALTFLLCVKAPGPLFCYVLRHLDHYFLKSDGLSDISVSKIVHFMGLLNA